MITRRIGCCGAGGAAGCAGSSGAIATGASGAGASSFGGATGASGAAALGFSTIGGAGRDVGGMMTRFSRTGAASSAGGAAGGAAATGGAGGFGCTADFGIATPRGTAVPAAGNGALAMAGTSGVDFFRARAISPGLESFEKSNLGTTPDSSLPCEPAFFGAGALAPKWRRILVASSSSRAEECVFLSVMPISGSASMMVLLFTSSSFASSLILIFDIRPRLFCSDYCSFVSSSGAVISSTPAGGSSP